MYKYSVQNQFLMIIGTGELFSNKRSKFSLYIFTIYWMIFSLREKPSERGAERHDQKYLASAGEKDVGPFDT